jgi:hypothetical protein
VAPVSIARAGLVGRRLRAGAALAAALLLAACARDPYVLTTDTKPVGEWRIEQQPDRMTGGSMSSAAIQTRTVSTANALFPPPVGMQLTCFREQPVIFFRFPFKVGSSRAGELSYRFDERPGHVPKAHFVDDYMSVVIEDQAEAARFAAELAVANVLYIRTRSYNAPRASAEFQVAGAPAAIGAGFAGCPLSSGPPAEQALQGEDKPAPKR